MKNVKSERLKKLENELKDLEEWLRLGLVPKKDVKKHTDEIQQLKEKIQEERDRLQFLRESGEGEEYIAPKRGQTKSGYTELTALPDIEATEQASSVNEGGFDLDSETETEGATTEFRDEDEPPSADSPDEESIEEESYFSDKNRWRRGGIMDPDTDDW